MEHPTVQAVEVDTVLNVDLQTAARQSQLRHHSQRACASAAETDNIVPWRKDRTLLEAHTASGTTWAGTGVGCRLEEWRRRGEVRWEEGSTSLGSMAEDNNRRRDPYGTQVAKLVAEMVERSCFQLQLAHTRK